MFKYVLQLLIGIFIFVVTSFIAWYEGSAITENTLEWRYSTPFTKLFNIEISNGADISQLDFFVYAVKFQPLFPTIMIISLLYILSVTGFYLIKSNSKWAIGFLGTISFIMLSISGLTFNSTTSGGDIYFWITSLGGLLFMEVAALVWSKFRKHKLAGNTFEM
ncbi:YjdJ family protein [Ureibacillus aquaedulcis]|uniref:YjdJ family protein n=1 Tax=Ureibacillus aquaedulcis TaxID=3058421 RepID=A0ABT8GN28_9BACL|nr:YjdJ family protein [Ureibacillus sp. BA0131]MDN4492815.1 YjdJ family protein [Ureibacillus sp. BA0131]